MADAVTSTTYLDGDRNVVMAFSNTSDGTGESAVTKVDVSALVPIPTVVNIRRIYFVTKGMGVKILWDATSDVLAIEIPADSYGDLDFSSFGGLANTKAAGYTGDIQFTTVAHSNGDTYFIILEMKKSG